MRILTLCFLLYLPAFAQYGGSGSTAHFGSSGPLLAAGCGVNTDNSTCGPRATNTYSTAGQTALPASSTCATINAAISSGSAGAPNKYFLVQNLGDATNPHVNCLGVFNDVTINMNGFTMYGNWCRNGDLTGFTLENGTILGDNTTANSTCAGQGGVITFTNGGGACPTQSLQFLDLKVRNSSSQDTAEDVHADEALSIDCSVPYWVFDHMDTETPPSQRVSRAYNFNLQGVAARGFVQTQVTNTRIHFLGYVDAQQGVSFSNCAHCLADHNLVIEECNPASSAASGRGISIDGSAGANVGSNLAQVTNNDFEGVCNNRATRVRNSSSVIITGNTAHGIISFQGQEGVFAHLGDPDNGNTDLLALDIHGNTIELGALGVGGWIRSGYMTGGLITGNTINCAANGCAGAIQWTTRQPASDGTRSEMRAKNEIYGAGMTPNWLSQYGRVTDVAPVFTYCGTTPTLDTSAGSVTAPTLTLNCN